MSIAAPIGGWNARDPLGQMDKLDAVRLENWFPGTGSVILRRGFTPFTEDGPLGQIETLMAYSSGTDDQLFAAVGTEIYNVTDGTFQDPLGSLDNARWQYVNFTTAAGSYLLAVNGADKMIVWDGSNWHQDGEGSPYDVTNVDTATCANIAVFKKYIWLIPEGSLKAYYLPINSIGGAATPLDMSSTASLGGYLMAAMTWTLDGGYGMDDHLVFITSNGEVIVWYLSDPATPTGIRIVGVYQLGSPIGRRCWMKNGGDLLIITRDGVVPLSSALQSSRLKPRISITDKIQDAMREAVNSYGSNFGWQLISFPAANQLYLNVPVSEGSRQEQYVMNQITGEWCKFKGWHANCWEIFNDQAYFGTSDGIIGKAWDGFDDNGSAINGLAIQSFQAYGGARQKQCHSLRPHLLTSGSPTIYGNVNADFDLGDRSAELSTSPVSFGKWGSAHWGVAHWGRGLIPSAEWQGATAIGYSFAPFLKASTQSIRIEWVSTDLQFEGGGTL